MKLACCAAVCLSLVAGQGMAAPPAAPRAQRIMSLKICTDELLLDLAPLQRIASVSYLSQEKGALQFWPSAARLPVNHNSPEEVLATKPDLVLTDRYITPAMRLALAKSGARVVEVPEAVTFDQIRAVTRLVGDAVGMRPRAEELIAHMDAVLAALDKPAAPLRVAGWGDGGYVPGAGTLFDSVLKAAGGVNIAGSSSGNPGGGYYDVEALLAARPDVLAFGDNYIDDPSLRRDQNDHPVLTKYFAERRVLYSSTALACGTPETAEAAATFQDALEAAGGQPGGVP